MNHLQISIIVPVYNAENTLCRCIDSLLSQSFKDFEIIAINDGSTDNSAKILNEYSEQDSRINIVSQNNAGVSVARNVGLEIAKCPYIMFIDSDDYLLGRDTIESNIQILEEDESLDLIQFPFIKIDQYGRANTIGETGYLIGDKNIFDAMFISHRINGYVNGKIYRRSIVDKMKFRKGYSLCEDALFFMDHIESFQKIYISDKGGYGYDNQVSTLSNAWNPKTAMQFAINVVKTYELCRHYCLPDKLIAKFWIESVFWLRAVYVMGGVRKRFSHIAKNSRHMTLHNPESCLPSSKIAC